MWGRKDLYRKKKGVNGNWPIGGVMFEWWSGIFVSLFLFFVLNLGLMRNELFFLFFFSNGYKVTVKLRWMACVVQFEFQNEPNSLLLLAFGRMTDCYEVKLSVKRDYLIWLFIQTLGCFLKFCLFYEWLKAVADNLILRARRQHIFCPIVPPHKNCNPLCPLIILINTS